MKKDYQKPLKKSTLFFLPSQVPFNVQSYQIQKGPGTSDQLLFRLQIKFRKIPLLVIYLSDQVWWCNIKQLLSYFKNYFANLCKPVHDINYSTSISPFVSGKCGKEGKKILKPEYLENEKSF